MIRAGLPSLDGFTALTAVGGGLALATGREGNRFPTELRRGTPFRSSVVPGLILAGVVGGRAAAATITTLRRPCLGAQVSMLSGAMLMGWIVAEVLILRAPMARSWAEPAYCGLWLLMAGLGFLGSRGATPQRPFG